MPYPRLLAVVALAVLGGLAGVVGAGDDGSPASSGAQRQASSDVRGGRVSHPAGSAIAVENQKPGSRDWRIAPARGRAQGLAAYAGVVSVAPGETVPLHLRGNGQVRTRAYRLGWYGGAGARQVWEGMLPATPQSGAAATWTSNVSLATTGLPEGAYLIRLDLGPASRYVPLTVTAGLPGSSGSSGSVKAAKKVVVLTSPMTWAAVGRNGSPAAGAQVSLDHPLAVGNGGGGLVADAGLIAQIERTGVETVYATDTGLAADPQMITGAAAVLVDGDSRYWTVGMRTAVRFAVAAGTDVAFFGADSAGVTAVLNPPVTDSPAVAAFRSFAVGSPAAIPAARLTGSVAACSAGAAPAGLTISDPSWWGFRGADPKDGEVLRGLVSGRVDRVSAPTGIRVVGSAALGCGESQATTFFERPSKARIFTAGTDAWACTVSGSCVDAQGRTVRADARAQQVAARVTRNLVRNFARS